MTNITFKGSKVISLNFKTEQVDIDEDFKLNFQVLYAEESEQDFMIRFDVEIASKDGTLINLEYGAFFKTDETITKEFLESPFPMVNAPAIAYPYLRSFVSTLTLNAGVESTVLPTINFHALVNKHQESASQ